MEASLLRFGRRNEPRLVKAASWEDVLRTISSIQTRQQAQRELKDLTRMSPLINAMNQLEAVVEVLQHVRGQLATIWGCIQFALQTSSTYPYAFDQLLDGYLLIGKATPLVQQYEGILEQHSQMRNSIDHLLQQMLEIHCLIHDFFVEPTWRQTFRPNWNIFAPRLKNHSESLKMFRQVLGDVQQYFQLSDRCHAKFPITFKFENNYVAGNNYGSVTVNNGSALLGNQYSLQDPSVLEPSTSMQISNLLSKLEIDNAEARNLLEQQEQMRNAEMHVAVKTWLIGTSSQDFHAEAYETHEKYCDTGGWILSNSKVAAWMTEDVPCKSMLWIRGVPGAGKTVLASVIVNACQQISGSDTAYFYCRHDDSQTCTSIAILRGMLVHVSLSQSCKDLIPYFYEQRCKSGDHLLSNQKTAITLLQTFCKFGGRRYLIVDGLDECPTDQRVLVLSSLCSLVQDIDQKQPGKVRLLIVSQREDDIAKALISAEEFAIVAQQSREDIRLFTSRWAVKIGSKFEVGEKQVDYIQQRTCFLADVMENLYAQPNVDSLRAEIREARFPADLSQAYERIIERIRKRTEPRNEWPITWKVLGWMVCAARPLKWHELQGAISINLETREVNFGLYKLRRHIQEICGALVSVSEDRVSLVHGTAKQFISESHYVDIPMVEYDLATLCLAYLSFQCFDVNILEDELRQYVGAGYFAFADYAIAKWTYHFQQVLCFTEELSDLHTSNVRKAFLHRLCMAVGLFACAYAEDLHFSLSSAFEHETLARTHPRLMQLTSNIPDAKTNFTLLWVHSESCRFRDPRSRHIASPEKLRKGFERIRDSVEAIVNDRHLPLVKKQELAAFYGTQIFKCSRTTCFYFHEGFPDARTRDKHNARHDRAYICSDPGCTTAEFGFASKRDLEKHVLAFHSNIEMKASSFEAIIAPEKNGGTFECSKCDKVFTRRGILRDHELTHIGQKPHECSKCGKAFTRKNDCVRHEKIHKTRGT